MGAPISTPHERDYATSVLTLGTSVSIFMLIRHE
jgi:hypothetical protein